MYLFKFSTLNRFVFLKNNFRLELIQMDTVGLKRSSDRVWAPWSAQCVYRHKPVINYQQLIPADIHPDASFTGFNKYYDEKLLVSLSVFFFLFSYWHSAT